MPAKPHWLRSAYWLETRWKPLAFWNSPLPLVHVLTIHKACTDCFTKEGVHHLLCVCSTHSKSSVFNPHDNSVK
jgi:hypothetical protein